MLTTSGYIISDDQDLIHGTGLTIDLAWADAEKTFADARIELLGDDDDSTEQHGSWARRSDLRCWPATAALLQLVQDRGGDLAWSRVAGVACTRSEAGEGRGQEPLSDITDLYATVAVGLRDNARTNSVPLAAGWTAMAAIETYVSDAEIEALTFEEYATLESAVARFLKAKSQD